MFRRVDHPDFRQSLLERRPRVDLTQFDLFTFIATIVNFLVLLLLLRALLFKRIIAAMDKREEEIGERYSEADSREQEAREERDRLAREREDLEARSEQIARDARESAAEEKRRLLDAARSEVQEARRKWQAALEEEKESERGRIARHIAETLARVLRSLVADLADSELETAMARKLVASMNDDLRARLREQADETPVVTSSRELGDQARSEISRALEDIGMREPRFELGDLLCGVQVRVASLEVDWNVDAYLDEVESRLMEAR